MATERLIIEVSEKGALVVKRNLEGVGDGAQRAEGSVQLLRRALGLIGGALAIRQIIGLADAFTNVQNRIRTVTSGAEELADVTERLFQISNDTRSAFDATVEVYTRVALAAKDLGVTQSQVLDFTESLNQAVVLSGASATEAAAGLLQLSQGLASGALRGDELRSVLEQLPVVADVIAKELKVTRGELRVMGQEGKITADIVLNAFANAREELEGRFNKTVPTVSQSFTVLRNNVVKLIGNLDKTTNTTATLSKGILNAGEAVVVLSGYTKTLTTAIISLSVAIGGVKFIAWAQAASGATTILGALTAGVNALKVGMTGLTAALGPVGVALLAIGAAATVTTLYFDKLNKLQDEIEATEERIYKARLERLQAQVREIRQRKAAEDGLRSFISALDEQNQILKQTKQEQEVNAALTKASEIALRDLTDAEEAAIRQSFARRNELEQNKALLEQIKGPQQEFIAQLATLERIKPQLTLEEYRAALISINEAFGNAPEGPQLPTKKDKPEDRNVVQDQLRSLQQEQELIGLSADARQRRSQIIQLENALLKDQKQLGDDDRSAVEALITENQGLARRSDLLAHLNETEAEFGVSLGLTDQVLASGAISADVYNQALLDVGKTVEEMQKKQQLFNDIFGAVWDNALRSIQDFVETGKLEFREFASSVLRSISDILAGLLRIQAQKALGAALNIPGFAGGGSFTVGGTGGIDSQLVAIRATPGEQVDVTTPNQQARGANQAAGQPINIINISDPNEITDVMASAEGEQAILNVISRNRNSVKQAVA